MSTETFQWDTLLGSRPRWDRPLVHLATPTDVGDISLASTEVVHHRPGYVRDDMFQHLYHRSTPMIAHGTVLAENADVARREASRQAHLLGCLLSMAWRTQEMAREEGWSSRTQPRIEATLPCP